MLADKTLLLKGVAGVAAVGGVVGGGFAVQQAGLFSSSSNADAAQSQAQNQENAEQAQKNAEEIKRQKEEKKTEINGKLDKLGINASCHLEIDNFSSPTAFSKECDLDQAKLQNIKFSNKAENSNVTVSGLTDGNIKLKIANKESDKVSYKFSGHSSKITISGDTDKPLITLKPSSEREFEENSEGKLSKVPASGATNASTLNTKIKALGLSNKCWFEEGENETSVECSLNKEELQNIKFSNKGNSEVTVEGLTGNIKLKIEKKGANKLGYKFSGASSKITITGDADKGKITLPQTEEREFEENTEGKLSKVSASSNASTFNTKLKTLNIPNKCRFEEGEDEGSIECTLSKEELQKLPFSNKGTADVTVEGLTDGGNIKLKIEKKTGNNQLGYKFSGHSSKLTISGDSTKPDIVLKENVEREFEEKDSKLKKVVKNASAASKIKEANKKLETIKLPDKCRFEEEDDETSLQCDVSNPDDLKNIKFLNKENNKDLTISGSTTGLKLTVNRFEDGEGERKYQTGVDLEFFFSGYSGEVKIQGDTSPNSASDIVLRQNITTYLTITNSSSGENNKDKLAKYFTSSTIDGKLGLSCTNNTSNITCTPLKADTTIKFLNSEGTDREEITVQESDINTQILDFSENSPNYELGIKFTGKANFPTANHKIQSGFCYEPKYIKGKG